MISVPRNIEVAVGQAQVVHIRSGIVMYTIFPSRWTVHKPTRSDSHMPLQAPLQHHLTHIVISRRRSPTSLPGGGRNGVAVATRPNRDSRTLTSDRGNINDEDTMHIYLYIHSANTMTNHFIWSGGVVPGQRKGKKAKKEKERIKEMKEHIQRESERERERDWEGVGGGSDSSVQGGLKRETDGWLWCRMEREKKRKKEEEIQENSTYRARIKRPSSRGARNA